jgi:hypothetical protein
LIKKIYISWRKKPGERRFLVALLQRSNGGNISFKYLDDFDKAKEQGLNNIIGFGKDAERLTSEQLYIIIRLRLVSKDKEDKYEFLQFWEAADVTDEFTLLALTQGKSPSDNLEFLGDYSRLEAKKINFVTDLSGLSHNTLAPNIIKEGDILTYKHEESNGFDTNAIAVYKENNKVGYIKKVHNLLFRQHTDLQIKVKTVYANGIIKQIFVKVTK